MNILEKKIEKLHQGKNGLDELSRVWYKLTTKAAKSK